MLGWFAETTVVAAGLAGLAALLGRGSRVAPEARHALWLVVLLRFLIPPVVAWPWATLERRPAPSPSVVAGQPGPPPSIPPIVEAEAAPPPAPTTPGPATDLLPPDVPELPRTTAASEGPQADPDLVRQESPFVWQGSSDPGGSQDRKSPEPGDRRVLKEDRGLKTPATRINVPSSGKFGSIRRFDWASLILGLWTVGTAIVILRGAIRIARFRRTLAGAVPAPTWLLGEVASVADRLGVRPPRVLVVPRGGSPLLWCLGMPRLILPERLGLMTVDARLGIIAHELAHLARLDHWVVRLELLAGLAWWWNPVFRLARRHLRAAAEAACDARVVRAYPSSRFAYAEALVNVSENQARAAASPLPALGIGVPRASRTLESRLLMILQDPIRPPSRRPALLALALLALSLPSWTLARPQQPAEPPQAEDPAKKQAVEPPSKPDQAPKPQVPEAKPSPAPSPFGVELEIVQPPGRQEKPPAVVRSDSSWTMDQIREGFQGRRWPDRALTFRCSLASLRVDQFRGKRVGVRAADVALGTRAILGEPVMGADARVEDRLGRSSRIDGLTAMGQGKSRRVFIAETPKDLVTFYSDSDQSGPISLRWLPARSEGDLQGDDLALALVNQPATDEGRNLDPIDPMPANLLDLRGATTILFQPNSARMEPAGVEVVDGVEAVRVAWITGPGVNQAHGLCWVAPSLGFAVVRLEASTNPQTGIPQQPRRSWRKVSSNFEKVGDLWLPHKVTYQTTNGPGDSNLMRPTIELVASFDEYRANPPLTVETFRPRFDIQGLDPATGNFIAAAPAIPPGLGDRLKRAEAESPFSIPRVEDPADSQLAVKLDEQRKAEVISPAKLQEPPTPREPPTLAGDRQSKSVEAREVVKAQKQLNRIREMSKDPGDPAQTRAEAQLVELQARLDQLRNEATAPSSTLQARREIQAAEVRKFDAKRDLTKAAVDRNSTLKNKGVNYVSQEEDAAAQANLRAAEAEVDREKAKFAEANLMLEQSKTGQPRGRDNSPNRDQAPLLQARRDAQAAEVRKFEARRGRAQTEVKNADKLIQRNGMSRDEHDLYQANLKAAEAEVDREKAKLVEAELMLDQAKVAPTVPPEVASSIGKPPVILSDYRELAELAELQVQIKQAELQKAESKVNRVKALVEIRRTLAKEGRITNVMMVDTENDYSTAQDEFRIKEVEVREAELRLKQARRRAEGEEVRLKRLAERSKAELDRAKARVEGAQMPYEEFITIRDRYDDLMFQLDPNHKASNVEPGDSNPAKRSGVLQR